MKIKIFVEKLQILGVILIVGSMVFFFKINQSTLIGKNDVYFVEGFAKVARMFRSYILGVVLVQYHRTATCIGYIFNKLIKQILSVQFAEFGLN